MMELPQNVLDWIAADPENRKASVEYRPRPPNFNHVTIIDYRRMHVIHQLVYQWLAYIDGPVGRETPREVYEKITEAFDRAIGLHGEAKD